MPELPEVETICRGISPHIIGKTFSHIIVRQAQLRWAIPDNLDAQCQGHSIKSVSRRAKYLLLKISSGQTIIIHLGMSGSLRITDSKYKAGKHDHVDFVFTDNTLLRFNDPRKFGSILLTTLPVDKHKLISALGPEPLSEQFDGQHLYSISKNKITSVKSFIMNGHNVVGVGNIYASESLFMAGIHPARQAGRISLKRYQKLAECIKIILQKAIDQGGTTLRDFVNEQGKPGYFQQSLSVYGRNSEACVSCSSTIKQIKITQRASYFCPKCQH
ncbi:MAG: bifunctional DNA-formamidopyrimidine glycosylase/DNA-(apurinic or apyrimidinic site) lyase [Methylococcales symbiont of Iophon sp. n. MRB-2018]|nr:MAG: bifunctional DNA-formamidopyrimidine glycosylase/DNA-(apurinic or apyrimidinic site) lyase [Methylococcales symbiont of Iophon sp. n. MRB-2018]KAF3980452.1 MAG: bifunctional DNA-formamidopyrimidine glycosylase/DNA-(apurinic or apyrimidinic site) lyase [Methylococcales symbiont of Iophon sp. n. MRB-2018]